MKDTVTIIEAFFDGPTTDAKIVEIGFAHTLEASLKMRQQKA